MSDKLIFNKLESKWRCPSNIALVKYWGKRDFQIPLNPSLSFVLENSFTETEVFLVNKTEKKLVFYFDGIINNFEARIEEYLLKVSPYLCFYKNYSLVIKSKNSFPHSAGIASSASSFAALALCLTELDFVNSGKELYTELFWQKASELARIGSGSACRSIYPGYSVWGQTPLIESSHNEYAINIKDGIDSAFSSIGNFILLVDSGKKEVSSSAGHALMNNHLFKGSRIAQANENINKLYRSMQNGNKTEFCDIIENEALSLHAMMMTSNPSFMLLKPASLEIINRIRDFRKKTGLPVCFTIDAGPNIHLLYFDENKTEIQDFVTRELIHFCENGKYIDDKIGSGPQRFI